MRKIKSKIIFQTRAPVDRRIIKQRRSSLNQEELDCKNERRKEMFERRITVERRKVFPDIIYKFWEETS